MVKSLTNGGTSAHIATIKHIIHCHGRPACSQLYDELETHIEVAHLVEEETSEIVIPLAHKPGHHDEE